MQRRLSQHIEALAPHFTLTRPQRAGRAPVLIMLHGCGGKRPFQEAIARVAADAGAVALSVDSYAPRRISRLNALATVCTGMRLHGRERAGDLYAAMAWAKAQDWADPARIAAIGWSHGGWTIMDALALRAGPEMARATGLIDLPKEPLTGLKAALIVYPYASVGSYCGKRAWRLNVASTAIVAEHDYIVGPTRGALERQGAHGAPLRIVTFAGATHAFEDDRAEDPRVRYNPAAAAREHDMVRAMIAGL